MVMLVLAGMVARGQQDPMFSQYMFNTLAFNPAYAGSADVFTLMALTRHQWVGFSGAPATQTLVGHSPLRKQHMALGGTILNDRAGPLRRTGAYMDYAYRLRTGEHGQLAFGLRGGAHIVQADLLSLGTVDADPTSGAFSSKLMPNFGFGVFWHTTRAYVGLSIPKLLESELADGQGAAVETAREIRHYFLMGGMVFDIGGGILFRPSTMIRVVKGAPLSADLNANFLLRDKLWLGAMYRWGNAFGFMAQYQFNEQFRAGYAFDLTTTRLAAYNAGTHEIMLGYDLRFSRGRTISPRYF